MVVFFCTRSLKRPVCCIFIMDKMMAVFHQPQSYDVVRPAVHYWSWAQVVMASLGPAYWRKKKNPGRSGMSMQCTSVVGGLSLQADQRSGNEATRSLCIMRDKIRDCSGTIVIWQVLCWLAESIDPRQQTQRNSGRLVFHLVETMLCDQGPISICSDILPRASSDHFVVRRRLCALNLAD